ncbi:MAG: SDR family NAD(P)-dependent oxidoreductase, partial [Alphaproteobacteria bacterium]|nr:SDR family NAD(P)-dependent oxidoreductase [Alphaproteobacteria bacterium]
MRDPRSILITGASSGIGEALAMGYAAPARTLALTGRDAGRLAAVADACRARGAAVLAEAVAVEDQTAMAAFLRQAEARAPLDLVIANAGVSRTLKDLGELDALTRETFAVNVTGVFNTLHPAIELMLPRRRGQLAIVSSIAGFRGLPGAIAYSASKTAVRAYGEALRGRLARQGIGVSVICPGYVRSRMTARNRFPMPFIMDAPNAASIIMRGL